MSNIEDDLKVLEKFMNNEMQRDKLERDIRCGGWKMGDIYKHLELNQAIKNILSEREQDKARIKELEKKLEEANKQLDLDYVDENYIPKQKAKEMQAKIKELEAKLEFKRYGDLDEIKFEEYMSQFIPKQKVKDKIEELENANRETTRENWHYIYSIQLKILQELLEEGE